VEMIDALTTLLGPETAGCGAGCRDRYQRFHASYAI
jgi:hypothetical protein